MFVLAAWLWLMAWDSPQNCGIPQGERCISAWAVVILPPLLEWVYNASGVPLGFIPPAGAGTVQATGAGALCSVAASTGKLSGVNVRQSPDFDAPIIGDLPLEALRPVTAIGAEWYETVTSRGRVGYVAARVTTLVGACGGVAPLP
ncbi:MAG: SH3 domain-containing protein [Phototrophicaceae bacterium]